MDYKEIKEYLVSNNYPLFSLVTTTLVGDEKVLRDFIEDLIKQGCDKECIINLFTNAINIPTMFIFEYNFSLNLNAMKFLPTRSQQQLDLLNADY